MAILICIANLLMQQHTAVCVGKTRHQAPGDPVFGRRWANTFSVATICDRMRSQFRLTNRGLKLTPSYCAQRRAQQTPSIPTSRLTRHVGFVFHIINIPK